MAVRSPNPTEAASRGERGQSLVETALFFTVLVTFMAGVIQVGITINVYLTVINATREGARYAGTGFSLTAQNIATITRAAAYPLPLSSSTATIIVTRVQTQTTSGTPAITGYSAEYASGLGTTQSSRFTQTEVLTRYSQGTQINGSDEFVIVEFFYSYPLSIWSANVPMYSYNIMRVSEN